MNDIMDAFFGPGEPKIETETQVTGYTFRLTPAQAHALYNDIYRITNDAGMYNVTTRQGQFKGLFALYDALHAAGVDGTGRCVVNVLLELFTECDRCPEWGVRAFSVEEKERLESIHANAKHTASADSVTSLLTADPSHDADVKAVVEAIEYDAAQHEGEVDPNRVRRLLPSWVQPQTVGATYNALVAQRRLERIGWTTNEDRRGRNVGKPLATYRLVSS